MSVFVVFDDLEAWCILGQERTGSFVADVECRYISCVHSLDVGIIPLSLPLSQDE